MPVTKKTVSLIVLNYNGVKHLKEYFTSVFNQTVVPDEVIMLDNLSTDGSSEYVEKYFPQVRIVRNTYNAGTAQGSNIAASSAKGDYLIFQSNDMRLDRHCIEELAKTINKEKEVGIVTSVLLNYSPDRKTGEHFIDNAGGIADVYGFGMQNHPFISIKKIPNKEEVFFSYGGSFIIPRKLFNKIHGFDNRYFTLNDDIDLSWRVRLLGYKIIYTKKSIIYHKVSATLGTLFNRSIKRYWSERNALRTILKNYDNISLVKRLPVYFLILFGEMGYFIYRRRFSLFMADLKALLWNIVYLPETILERIKIQKLKKRNNIEKIMIHSSLKLKLFGDFKKVI